MGPTLARAITEALDSLGNRLAGASRLPAALAAASESVKILGRLATVNPEAHQRNHALALNSLASRLWRLREHEASLKRSEEAVAVAQQLVGRNNAGRPVLGIVLNNFAQHLAEVGRKDEALAVIDEAVRLWRSLVRDESGIFEKRLDRALSIRLHLVSKTN